jgi:hypothetical protein
VKRHSKRRARLRRARRILVLGTVAALVALVAVSVYVRLDKTEVFDEMRGTYAGFGVLEAWQTGQSDFRLIAFRNHRGEAVSTAYVRRPLKLNPDYYIILTYAGAKTGKKILGLIPERSDLVLVSVQYPYQSPRSALAYPRWPYDVRQAAFRTVAGGMLAVSFLDAEEDLDLDNLTVVGLSVGSTFATIHGSLDERVPVTLLIHGGGDLPLLVRTNVKQRWLALPASLVAEILVHSFDPIHYADRIAPRKLVMISSRNDSYFPVASAEALYSRADEPKEIIWTATPHVRSKKADLVAEIVGQIEQYLAAQKPRAAGR